MESRRSALAKRSRRRGAARFREIRAHPRTDRHASRDNRGNPIPPNPRSSSCPTDVPPRNSSSIAALAAAALLATGAVASAAPSSAAKAAPAALSAGPSPAAGFVASTLPDSHAGRQAAWLIDVSHRLPLSEAELRTHTSARLRAQIGARAQRPALLRALRRRTRLAARRT